MSIKKTGFQINFINSSCLENNLKESLPPWFYKNHFKFKNKVFNFTLYRKSNNYQNIIETHNKLSI